MKWEDFVGLRRNLITVPNTKQTNITCPDCNEKLFVRTDFVLAILHSIVILAKNVDGLVQHDE